jgi:hypothetical protein
MMKNDRLKTIFLAGNNFGVQHFGMSWFSGNWNSVLQG